MHWARTQVRQKATPCTARCASGPSRTETPREGRARRGLTRRSRGEGRTGGRMRREKRKVRLTIAKADFLMIRVPTKSHFRYFGRLALCKCKLLMAIGIETV